MPDKHIWLTVEASAHLRTLARRWGLSDSATIAEALRRAHMRAIAAVIRSPPEVGE